MRNTLRALTASKGPTTSVNSPGDEAGRDSDGNYDSPDGKLEDVNAQPRIEIAGAPASALGGGSIDPVYEAKAQVLNKAIQDIGMGRYQWQLFIVIGFGWASDNLWPIITSLIFTPVANEWHPTHAPILSLSQNIGLLIGAIFWGFGLVWS